MLWKMPGERVIVALGDRVELVVVAAGAGDRQAEEGLRVVASICSSARSSTNCPRFSASWALLPRARKPVAIELLGPLAVVSGGEEVAGDLLADELVVRLVGVERGDRPSRGSARPGDT